MISPFSYRITRSLDSHRNNGIKAAMATSMGRAFSLRDKRYSATPCWDPEVPRVEVFTVTIG